jgi:IclR family acetate operon transcriptional repressor
MKGIRRFLITNLIDVSKRDLVKSAARSLDILDYLADHPGGASLTDLHRHLHVPVSSLHNIIMTMVQKGYLARNEVTLMYYLGNKIGQLANSYYEQVDLIQLADPYMSRLARLTGETASLTVLRGNQVVFIHKVSGESVRQVVNPVGSTLAAHATGSGKVMLAYLPEGELDHLYPHDRLEGFAPNTITSKRALRDKLTKIAIDGYAFDDEESTPGIWAVAGCIRDRHGLPVAAISIAGFVGHIKMRNYLEWPQPVQEMTAEISTALGYRPTKLNDSGVPS